MPYGQEITDNKIRDCWEQILSSSKYEERKIEIGRFNRYFMQQTKKAA